MTDIRTAMQANAIRSPDHPEEKAQRHAAALAEIQKTQQDNILLIDENAELKRGIERLQDHVMMLREQLDAANRGQKIYMRKMVSLAQTQKNIMQIAKEGDQIMKEVNDLMPDETEEQATTERASAADIVKSITAISPPATPES